MKKLLLGIIVILSACSPAKRIYHERVVAEDYRDYNMTGFNVYPINTPILTKYTPVGDISIFFYIGEKAEKSSHKRTMTAEGKKGNYFKEDEVYKKDGNYEKYRSYHIPTRKYMLDKLVGKAKEMGANALINYVILYKGGEGYEAKAIAVKMHVDPAERAF